MAGEFRGTDRYIATEELMAAVNAAMVLSRPLLIKGEPGTGKTLLAAEIARSLVEAAVRVAHQVHHQGAAGAVRIRRGVAPARFAARRPAGQGHRNYIVKGISGRRSTATCSRCC
jgi:DNA polymerase III delta prime subunit